MKQIKTELQQKLQELEGLFFDILLSLENCETAEQADAIDAKLDNLSRELSFTSTCIEFLKKSFRVTFANLNSKKTTQKIVNWEVESSIDYQRAGKYVDFER